VILVVAIGFISIEAAIKEAAEREARSNYAKMKQALRKYHEDEAERTNEPKNSPSSPKRAKWSALRSRQTNKPQQKPESRGPLDDKLRAPSGALFV
jgi:hypothetical protein